jgi:monoamine oxidase
MRHPVLIVGGGLAGLNAARLLHRDRIEFQLREARPRLGGRILTADASGEASTDGFDLGPSWFWPRMQAPMAARVEEMGLATVPQSSDGDGVFHRMSREAPQRYRSMQQEPQSMRLVGGTGALVQAISSSLPPECIRLGSRLTDLALTGNAAEAHFVGADGSEECVRASDVILAMPPRLLATTVSFSPALDEETASRWRGTPTWMAPHAKFFALYDHPFWLDAGLSGTAQSMAGPLVEIHDATTAAGQAALFGFVGIPAAQRKAIGREAITAASVRQLVTLFGPDAGAPRVTLWKDWAADTLTATDEDWTDGAHPVVDDRAWIGGEWRDHVSLAGSETSQTEPGYLAGAVHAAERAVAEVERRIEARLTGTDAKGSRG